MLSSLVLIQATVALRLVFFLGGIPDNTPTTTSFSCTGFARSTTNPAAHFDLTVIAGTTPLPAIDPPMYEFKTANLVNNDPTKPASPKAVAPVPYNGTGSLQRSLLHYSYLDNYGRRPYAYLSSPIARNGYNALFTLFADSDCRSLVLEVKTPAMLSPCVFPYVETIRKGVGPSSWKYWKPESYQLISAGKDYKFGYGSQVIAGQTDPLLWWTTATAEQVYPNSSSDPYVAAGADDQTNFAGSPLGTGGN